MTSLQPSLIERGSVTRVGEATAGGPESGVTAG
jgi:hypothetical protein